MRPKIVAVVLLAGLAAIFAVLFSKRPATSQNQAVTPAVQPTNNPSEIVKNVSPPIIETSAEKNVLAVRDINTNGLSEHDFYVHEHLVKLSRLQANDDAESLREILSDLTNSDSTIRAAALESTIQFSSRDAIPYLTNLAANTQDPVEKKNLLDAADYLALPSWTEIHEQNPNAKFFHAPADTPPSNGQP